MAKLFKKIFTLFMVFTFIFSTFGCSDEEQSDSLPVINKVESLSDFASYTNIARFKYYSQIKDFISLNGGKTDKYFASINFDDFKTHYGITYDCGGINDKAMVLRTGGDRSAGAYDTALIFSMYAYPVSEKPTNLTFEHFITDSEPVIDWNATAKEKAVFISSGDEVIVKFFYAPFKEYYTEEYIENFLKERLQWIGSVSDEQDEIRVVDLFSAEVDLRNYWEKDVEVRDSIYNKKIEMPGLWNKTCSLNFVLIEGDFKAQDLTYEYTRMEHYTEKGALQDVGVWIYIYHGQEQIGCVLYFTDEYTPDYFTVLEFLKENLEFKGENS